MTVRGRKGGDRAREGRRTSGLRRAAGWAVRLVGLFVAVLLVVGLGLGVRPPEPDGPSSSPTEQAQLDAEAGYTALAADARSAAALDPAAADVLTALAEDLEVQADAVALPRSPAAPTQDPEGSEPLLPSPEASSTPGPAVTADGRAVLAGLRESALRSLHDAAQAEPGPGRVLAAAGANQWRNAVLLSVLLGADPGLPPADAVPATDLAAGTGLFSGLPGGPDGPSSPPSVPSGPATAIAPTGAPGAGPGPSGARPGGAGTVDPDVECTDTPLGPDADRAALLEAKAAEERAAYAYDVAAALLPEPGDALARSGVHRAAADAAAERLALLCAPAGPAPAGHALGTGFRADPAGAVRELEQDHAVFYVDLLATVGPEARAWAVTSYNAAAQRSLDAGTPLTALPGLEDAADPAGGAAPGTTAPSVAPEPGDG
ncbi:DUF4439 domain-containing protein [Arthrobacter sp. Leaf234]|uniref:DUF4439 domain-containing protein n=1 Tax=Arthrobacter sp. Leaf234 TaxID=1736303 RepID=UPI00138F2352|nr:DUF4439 domain-containing protein [Arthrobacter sp. Leaf234]